MAVSAQSPATPSTAQRRVPDFFIVGAPKTGTTALYRMLQERPRIYMPELKEPRFLASDMRPRAGREQGLQEHGYPTTLEQYLALFDDAAPQQRVGEASAFYLWSRTAAASIAQLQPRARIIAIVREPASFLCSLHLMYLRWSVEAETDLGKALSLEPARREGKRIPRHSHRPQLLQYSEHVRFVEQLSRYSAHFPHEQMLVLVHEDFRRDNEATVRRVLRFLDADDDSQIAVKKANVTKVKVRSPRANLLAHTVARGRGPAARSTKAVVKALTTPRARYRALQLLEHGFKRSAPEPPDERLMLELRRRFKPEVVALSEYLGRDLVRLWGYENID